MADFEFLKHSIRALLLSLGKCATEHEFRKAWYETEGSNFNEKLKEYGMNFYNFFEKMPDVARVHYDQATKNIILTRVSGNAASSFMDKMTVQKYGKNYKGPKLKVSSNSVPFIVNNRPLLRPVSRLNQSSRSNSNFFSTVPRLLSTNNNRLSANAVPFRSSVPKAIVMPIRKNSTLPQLMVPLSFPERNNMQNVSISSRPQPIFSSLSSSSRLRSDNTISHSTIPSTSSQISINNNSKSNKTVEKKSISKKTLLKTLPPLREFKTVRTYPPKQSPPREANDHCSVASTSTLSTSSSTVSTSSTLSTSSSVTLNGNFIEKNETFYDSDAASSVSTEYMSVKSIPSLRNSDSTATLVSSSHDISQSLSKSELSKRETPIQLKNRLSSLLKLKLALNRGEINQPEQKSPISLNFSFESPNYKHGDKAFFRIKILDVDSPDCFTFQFSLEKLEVLMDKLNRRYDSLKNLQDYKVKNIKIGMMVAVRNINDNNRWYRAEIKEVNSDKLGVRFVDYLTVKKQIYMVVATDVYNLEQEFAKESSKSAFARIHGVKPKQKVWCQNSKLEFELVKNENENLMATIKKIKNGVFSLSIIINQIDFIRMSDYMLSQNYALVDFDDFLHLTAKNQRSLI